jgi:hypothetical protein
VGEACSGCVLLTLPACLPFNWFDIVALHFRPAPRCLQPARHRRSAGGHLQIAPLPACPPARPAACLPAGSVCGCPQTDSGLLPACPPDCLAPRTWAAGRWRRCAAA